MLKLTRTLLGSLLFATFVFSSAAQAQYLQCAPFAREFSGIQLFGRAAAWWDQAAGKYARGGRPRAGAVLAFKAAGSMRSGHVATVTRIVDDRTITVTHANWSLINGRRGQIERDVTVKDVSAGGDWSKVRVWYAPMHGIGLTSYPIYGFIYADKSAQETPEPEIVTLPSAPEAPIQLASLTR